MSPSTALHATSTSTALFCSSHQSTGSSDRDSESSTTCPSCARAASAPVMASYKHSYEWNSSASAPPSLFPLRGQSSNTTNPFSTPPIFGHGSSSADNSGQLFSQPPSSCSSAPSQASGLPSVRSASVNHPLFGYTNCSSSSSATPSTQSNIFGTQSSNNHGQNFSLPFPSSPSGAPFPLISDTRWSDVATQGSSSPSFATDYTNIAASTSSDSPFQFGSNSTNITGTQNSATGFPFQFGTRSSSGLPNTQSGMIFGTPSTSVNQSLCGSPNFGSSFPASSVFLPPISDTCCSNVATQGSSNQSFATDCTNTADSTTSDNPFQFGSKSTNITQNSATGFPFQFGTRSSSVLSNTQSGMIFGTPSSSVNQSTCGSPNFGSSFPASSAPLPPISDTRCSNIATQGSSNWSFAPQPFANSCTITTNSTSTRFQFQPTDTSKSSANSCPFQFGTSTANCPGSRMDVDSRRWEPPTTSTCWRWSGEVQSSSSLAPSSRTSSDAPSMRSVGPCEPPTTSTCSWRWSGEVQSNSSLDPSSRTSSDAPSTRFSTVGLPSLPEESNAGFARPTGSCQSTMIGLVSISVPSTTTVDTGGNTGTWSTMGHYEGGTRSSMWQCGQLQNDGGSSTTSVSWARQESVMSTMTTSQPLENTTRHHPPHHDIRYGTASTPCFIRKTSTLICDHDFGK